MSKIKCKCGNTIGLGDIPSPNQSLIISDVKFDNFQGLVDVEKIYDEMKIVVHCENCSRLYIYFNGFNLPPTIYIKDFD